MLRNTMTTNVYGTKYRDQLHAGPVIPIVIHPALYVSNILFGLVALFHPPPIHASHHVQANPASQRCDQTIVEVSSDMHLPEAVDSR